MGCYSHKLLGQLYLDIEPVQSWASLVKSVTRLGEG